MGLLKECSTLVSLCKFVDLECVTLHAYVDGSSSICMDIIVDNPRATIQSPFDYSEINSSENSRRLHKKGSRANEQYGHRY